MTKRALPEKPYKFLDSYSVEDAPIFFGRERETRVLLSDVVVNRLVVLFARTGTGKTSLINAGVRPLLQQKGYETFFVRVHREPADSARTEILMQTGLAALEGERFADQLESVVRELQRPIVLFFDQFEEFFLYTHKPNPAAGREFILDVARLYRNRDAGVHFVFSMREEFFVEMDSFRDEIPNIFHNESNLRLRRFDRDQARDAIVQPARAFQTQIHADLVEQLLQDLSEESEAEAQGGTDEIEPAQLQIVCDTLWENRSGGEITLDQYCSLGRGHRGNIAQQVLYDRLEQVFEAIDSPAQLELLDRLLPELRTKEGTKYVRDVEGLNKAMSVAGPPVEIALRELLALLEKARFLRFGQRDSLEVVELSHDYLVGHLDRLRERVRLIWPRRNLREALDRYRVLGVLARQEELEAVAEQAPRLDLTREEAEFLFRSALECGYRSELWFHVAAARDVQIWKILSGLLAHGVSVVPVSHGIDLCERLLLEEGDGVAKTSAGKAFQFLSDTLQRDDLTLATQETLVRLIGGRNVTTANSATMLLLDFLSTSLKKGRISSSAIAALARIERKESVTLLRRALDRADLVREAQAALSQLTRSQKDAISSSATDLLAAFLEKNIEKDLSVDPVAVRALGYIETKQSAHLLQRALMVEDLAAEAKIALERLSTSKLKNVASLARDTLSRGLQTGFGLAHSPGEFAAGYSTRRPRQSSRGATESTILSLAESVRQGRCILFLGGGVHAAPPQDLAWAYPEEQRPPQGWELARRLAEEIRFESLNPVDSPNNFRRVAQVFAAHEGRMSLLDSLKKALHKGRSPSPMLEALARLPFPLILTTNFDLLLEAALQKAQKPFEVASYEHSPEKFRERELDALPDKPLVVKLHGSLDHHQSVVLTEDDFVDFTIAMVGRSYEHRVLPDVVRFLLSKLQVLFIGSSMRGLEHRFLLNSLFVDQDRYRGLRIVALQPHADPLFDKDLEARYRIHFITEDIWSFVPELYRAVTGKELPGFPPAEIE